jgi:hypothetical protein
VLLHRHGVQLLLVNAAIIGAVAVLWLVADTIWRGGPSRWMRAAETFLGRLSRYRRLTGFGLGLAAFALSASIALLVHWPVPCVHDEFSYLLAADTFAHGRLTNPTHPMWLHLETIHVIQRPSYASRYPPGQGMTLALGQWIAGYPIVGVWVSTAVASMAVFWMLLGWLPGRWALFGGILLVLHPLVIEWSQSYWGGAVAMTGGALVLGGFRRIVRKPRAGDGLVAATGAALLAVSRPYEGAALSLAVMMLLFLAMMRAGRQAIPLLLRRVIAPGAVVLAVSGLAIAYYNERVTGNALRLPYLVYKAEYGATPIFLWQRAPPEPKYRHEEIRRLQVDEYRNGIYEPEVASVRALLAATIIKFGAYAARYCRLELALPLLVVPWALGSDAAMSALSFVVFVFTGALLLAVHTHFYFAAPIMGGLVALVIQSIRHVRAWRWHGKRVGRVVARLWTLSSLIGIVVVNVFPALNLLPVRARLTPQWCADRARIQEELKRAGGKHLVIVQYGARHSPHNEWVYNGADIDSASVVWARDTDNNAELYQYFKDRRVWFLRADERSLRERIDEDGLFSPRPQ